jgi:Gpi18-like mannosyltransferase
VLLNPVVIHDSAYWGQVDSIPTALVIACLLALIAHRWWLAALLQGLALLTKPQTLVIAPVVGAVVLVALLRLRRRETGSERKDLARLAVALAVACLGVAVILAPIVRGGALGALVDAYAGLGSQYPYLTLCAFNLWWFLTAGDPIASFGSSPRDDVAAIFGVTPKAIGIALLLVAAGFVLAAIVRRRGDRAVVVLGALTMAMAFFCLPTEIHERYGYPISTLAILAALAVGRRYWWVAAASSLTHFANALFGGLAGRPGGCPTTGITLALASTPALTYAIAAVNLVLLAIVAIDLHRLAFGSSDLVTASPAGRLRRGGIAGPRRRR